MPNAEHPALDQSIRAWKAASVYANRGNWMAAYETMSSDLGLSKQDIELYKKEFSSAALKLSVYTLPTIIFFEELPNNQVRTITRIKGPTSYNQIYSVYQTLLGEFSRLPASDPNSTRLPERTPLGQTGTQAPHPRGDGLRDLEGRTRLLGLHRRRCHLRGWPATFRPLFRRRRGGGGGRCLDGWCR